MTFTAAIVEINDSMFPVNANDYFKESMSEIADSIGYDLTTHIVLPFDETIVKREVARLIDEEGIGLVFVRNRGIYSMNEALFDLEDRSFRDVESWRRSWSRQRILYNDYNHAITLVRDDSFIMNFEGAFTSVSRELIDILAMWKENCISQNS